jgi:hypothetical protein
MGTNTILAIGAIVIFGTFLSSSNKLMIGNTQIAEQNEYYFTALSLAQSVIAEAKTKAFDQKTVSTGVSVSDSLSATLGSDGSTELVPSPDTLMTSSPYTTIIPGFRSSFKFNDIDDYNGYKRKVNTPRAEGYTVSVTVAYASSTYPDSTKFSQTFCKKMSVTVKSPFMPDSVAVSYAFVY